MKKHVIFDIVILFILALVPSLALGFEFGGISFESHPNDKSLFYLGQIFGSVGTALPGSGNALLGRLFTVFNIAVLALGSIVVSYTIILSTINTAQEGEVMGKKWSSMWIPLRSAVGMSFLIPTAGGYSILQIIMMHIVVLGVGAANQVWSVVVDTMADTQGPGMMGSIEMSDEAKLKTAADNIFSNMICVQAINEDVKNGGTCSSVGEVSAYSMPNGQVYFGSQTNASYSKVCGTAKAGGKPSRVTSTAWNDANAFAVIFAATSLSPWAAQVVKNSPPTGNSIIFTAMNTIKGTLTQVQPTLSGPQSSTSASAGALGSIFGGSGGMGGFLQGMNQMQAENQKRLAQAKENGWLFAGSFYFTMIGSKNEQYEKYNSPEIAGQGSAGQLSPPIGSVACLQRVTSAQKKATQYTELTDPKVSGPSESLSLPSQSRTGKFVDLINEPVQKLFNNFMKKLSEGNPAGPVASLRDIGGNIINAAEIMFFATLTGVFFVFIAGCVMSAQSPFCSSLIAALLVLVPMLITIVVLLWGVGALLGIYVPLIPYLVFTFTALGWLLLVIETIVAAPIVALGLVSPSAEHLGKASPAVILITNVFLRPTVMVIGLVAAVYLVNAVISMFNFGFFSVVKQAVGNLGIFGNITLLVLYGGTVLTLINECFSLIHVLPDKIIRWIGGEAQQSQVDKHVQEAKGSVEKGAKIGESGLQAGGAAFQKYLKGKSGGDSGGGGGKGKDAAVQLAGGKGPAGGGAAGGGGSGKAGGGAAPPAGGGGGGGGGAGGGGGGGGP